MVSQRFYAPDAGARGVHVREARRDDGDHVAHRDHDAHDDRVAHDDGDDRPHVHGYI